MFICVFRNQIPTISPIITIIKESPNCMLILVENMVFSFSLSPFPNSNVINLLIADVNEPLSMVNIATIPPTAL